MQTATMVSPASDLSRPAASGYELAMPVASCCPTDSEITGPGASAAATGAAVDTRTSAGGADVPHPSSTTRYPSSPASSLTWASTGGAIIAAGTDQPRPIDRSDIAEVYQIL